jgi:hypothetical protein
MAEVAVPFKPGEVEMGRNSLLGPWPRPAESTPQSAGENIVRGMILTDSITDQPCAASLKAETRMKV